MFYIIGITVTQTLLSPVTLILTDCRGVVKENGTHTRKRHTSGKSRNAPRAFAERPYHFSDIESEQYDVAVFNDVLLALAADKSFFFRLIESAAGDYIVV